MKPIRVLQVVPNMHAAGLENFIMNIYRNIDREKVQFDFLYHYAGKSFFDDEIEKLGGNIYHLTLRDDRNLLKYLNDLDSFFKNHNEYLIVHGHMASTAMFYLKYAKKYNIPFRIIHSHNSSTEKTFKGTIKKILLLRSPKYANNYFACSIAAGKFLFKNKEFKVVNNAIDLKKFYPNKVVRTKLRKKLNLENKFVIGQIGRFSKQKNHKFMLDVLKELLSFNNKFVLLLVGEGELESQIRDYVKKQNLENNVIFGEVTNHIEDVYQIIDVFVLPSLFEGLPVVSIESQASGTKTLMSNKITKEAAVSKDVVYLPLKKIDWVNYIFDLAKTKTIKKDNYEIIKENGFDIVEVSKKLEKTYLNMYTKGKDN